MLKEITLFIKSKIKEIDNNLSSTDYVYAIWEILSNVKTSLVMATDYRYHKDFNPRELVSVILRSHYRLEPSLFDDSYVFKDSHPVLLSIRIVIPDKTKVNKEDVVNTGTNINDVFDIQKFINGAKIINAQMKEKEKIPYISLNFAENQMEEIVKHCSFQLNGEIHQEQLEKCYAERNEMHAFNHIQIPTKYDNE